MNIKRTDSIFISVPGERFTPFLIAKKLHAKAILESASFLHGRERYSILMLDEAFRVVQDLDGVAFLIDGERNNFYGQNGINKNYDDKNKIDILDALLYVSNENPLPPYGIPLPASGIGYLSYEFCRNCDKITLSKQDDELNLPESEFIVGHIYMIFDHFTDTIHIFGLNYNEHEIDLEKEIEDVKKRLNNIDFTYFPFECIDGTFNIFTDIEESKKEYIEKVNIIKDNIIKGNLLQAVPSRRIKIESDINALEFYRRLRSVNPSPYMVYINYGNYEIIGASPESLVRVRDSVASIRPIAGTCRRGRNVEEDDELKDRLLKNQKEISEHTMLVDLARNDLGRICISGSVRVARFMDVEFFSHVMHIVSDVVGQVSKETKAIDVLRASFPAGTVSGAPKIKAIEILSSIEKVKRRFYAGAIGYMEADGDLDFCISIRCALKQKNIYTLQAGGGIVYDSITEREWEETEEKLAAMMDVFKGDSR